MAPKALRWLADEITAPPFSREAALYHIARDAIVVLDVFSKRSRATPKQVVDRCKRRLRRYEEEH